MRDFTLQKKGEDSIVVRTAAEEEKLEEFLGYDVEIIKSMEVG